MRDRTSASIPRNTHALLGLAALLLLGSVPDLHAIPAFARKYRVSCQLCHKPIPTLTEFGETFAGNGFRFSADELARDTVDTGDNLLELAQMFPLAMRFDGYGQVFINGEEGPDFEAPYNLKILSGGTISSALSYYFYFLLFERGEIGGIEDAYIYWNGIADYPLDLLVGQFQVSDPMFKRELRLEFEDYAIYRARIGAQPADLTYDRGISLILTPGEFTFTASAINGNGRGEALENHQFDDDLSPNVFAHVTRPLSPRFRLGLMGYYGQQTGQATGVPVEVENEVWMLGADASIVTGAVELNLQYVHREDDEPNFTPGDPMTQTDGGFAEAVYRFPGDRWYAVGLYNYVYSDRPLLDVRLGGPEGLKRWQTISIGFGYVLRRNFRLMTELGWDIEQESSRSTIGLVTAY